MSKYKSGSQSGYLLSDAEAVFWTAVDVAEVTRQNAVRAATDQAGVRAADLAYHRAVVAAAAAAGHSGNPGLGGQSRQALRELGAAGT